MRNCCDLCPCLFLDFWSSFTSCYSSCSSSSSSSSSVFLFFFFFFCVATQWVVGCWWLIQYILYISLRQTVFDFFFTFSDAGTLVYWLTQYFESMREDSGEKNWPVCLISEDSIISFSLLHQCYSFSCRVSYWRQELRPLTVLESVKCPLSIRPRLYRRLEFIYDVYTTFPCSVLCVKTQCDYCVHFSFSCSSFLQVQY